LGHVDVAVTGARLNGAQDGSGSFARCCMNR
jgi:hypothetical protein